MSDNVQRPAYLGKPGRCKLAYESSDQAIAIPLKNATAKQVHRLPITLQFFFNLRELRCKLISPSPQSRYAFRGHSPWEAS